MVSYLNNSISTAVGDPLRVDATGNFPYGTDLTLVPQFTNVQPNFYWSGTEISPGISARWFNPDDGSQFTRNLDGRLNAVAVRPADVAAAVPEPQSLALVLLALGAGAVAWRRRPL